MTRPERRELIIDAAERAFHGRDPASVTFEDIADEAGISRSLVYSYFRDRADLLDAVRERSEALLRAEVTGALSSVRGRREALGKAVAVHLNFARRDRTAYSYATGETPDRARTPTEERLVSEMAGLFGGTPNGRIVGLGIVHAIRAMVGEHVLTGREDDDRDIGGMITAFIGGALAGLEEIGLSWSPTWVVPLETVPPAQLPA